MTVRKTPTTVKIGVMSDTHGNHALMHRVAALMTEKLGATVIIHAGDDYADAQELVLYGHDVRMVPGLWCREYNNPRIRRRIHEEFQGVAIACAHADKDLQHEEYAAAIIITGHTHVARIEHIGKSVFLNPGHLKALHDRGQDASFAMIHIEDKSVRIAIHELTGGVRLEKTISRTELA
jgi:putative phosphoesterase